MSSVWPNSTVRSSLEEMLECLQRRDEDGKAKDVPPALPLRPRPTSRARLPCTKRPLPSNFQVGESDISSSNGNVKKDDTKRLRGNRFGAKKVKELEPGESPYFMKPSAEEKPKVEEKDNITKSPTGSLHNRESDWNDTVGYFIEKKLRVWCWRHNCLWESGRIQSTSGDKASVLLSDGSVVKVPVQDLLPATPDILNGVDDLTQLCYLNEPSILHNLQHRYSQDILYSKAGPLLLAVNPFKDVKLYGNDLVMAYRQELLDSPHVYAVANTAYNEMMTDGIKQSIIISGESGAGKTETAKIAMQYLAAFGGDRAGIVSELLQANYVLEAFGNAKTYRNDNSTRFGKLVEIHFNATGQICGAKIQTFLLEKSRTVERNEGERSYHIFYQLCAGASSILRGRLRLRNARDYNYLNQSDCIEIHDVDDAQKFSALMGALNTVGICKEDQKHVFEILAAVLWVGNITFRVADVENHIEVVADEAVTKAAGLIGCKTQDLILALSTHRVQAGKDEVTERLTLQQAIDARDALAKFMYASLFDWLVGKINSSLEVGEQQTGRSISILDIYGFESNKKNSFEQFRINYANERLQQHFNRHLFKLPQEEYELDGIDWTKVGFEDNLDCVDLFEKKPTGLISLLDEESNNPDATDLTFATKLRQQLNGNDCFRGEKGGAFSVFHCAGEVLYDTEGFLDKNRDPLHNATIQLLSSCTSRLPQLFASALLKYSQKPAGSSIQLGMLTFRKQSVATQFKAQVFELMHQLENTRPHFIHCIKPNSKQLPGAFENDVVLEQLRCCGVLEVVKITRFGYPTRMTHLEFTGRYGFLLPGNSTCKDPLSTSAAILQQFGIPPAMYQVGYTKLYIRAGQIGALEDVRKQFLRGTLDVQKCIRCHCARRCLNELKGGVITLQSFVRGERARKEYGGLISFKKQGALEKLDGQLRAVVQIQSVIRGWLARKHLRHILISNRSNVSKLKSGRMTSEVKDLPPEISPSFVEELQSRVLVAERTIEQKEKENEVLRAQLQQFEARCSGYEAKMKSMEDKWQNQMASLRMKLAATENSIATANTSQPGRQNGTLSTLFYESEEDISLGPKTPDGSSTPVRFVDNGIDTTSNWEDINSGIISAVSPLVKEFEQRKQNFENEVQAMAEFNPSNSTSANPVQEFRRLKERFEAWKKDYTVRLRETKVKVHKMGQTDSDKHRRKWWGMKSIRF